MFPLRKRGIKGDLIFKISLNLPLPKGDLIDVQKEMDGRRGGLKSEHVTNWLLLIGY